MKRLELLWMMAVVLLAAACTERPSTTLSKLKSEDFHTVVDGKTTDLYVLKNNNKMEVCITNYGGRIVSIMVPDRHRVLRDVALGCDSIGDYLHQSTDMGAIIGRYAGIIKNGHAHIEGERYQLQRNEDNNCVDGGEKGFQDKVFDAQQISSSTLILTYISKNEEEGFPGNLVCTVTYKLTDDNTLDIKYSADTDRPTFVSLTNRIYFNLSGNPSLPALDELLAIRAKYFLTINKSRIPTGKFGRVKGTPMDFIKLRPISKHINDLAFQQIKATSGYDHCYVLNDGTDIKDISCELADTKTGIKLDIFTDEPCVQFYSGNRLDGTIRGKQNIGYNQFAGIVLAPQHYPNAALHPHWGSVLLKPGQKYEGHTIYRFTLQK
jgi:aldose 1-epimerase